MPGYALKREIAEAQANPGRPVRVFDVRRVTAKQPEEILTPDGPALIVAPNHVATGPDGSVRGVAAADLAFRFERT